MDSGNSGSLQSSSGAADEDYDSRTESMSSFLNPILQPPSSASSHLPLPLPLDSAFFDPSLNPAYDPIWSRNIRPGPSFGAGDVFFNSQQGAYANQSPSSGHHQVGVATKNPKKRTRASRRAPTTVLTTDTTNFRQMVQEFTGIPTAPFSASSSPYSRRLDLFGGGGVGPLYPVRPSPHKMDASPSNYQLPPSDILNFPKQPQSFINSQNPLFSFQSLLQTKLTPQVNATDLVDKSDSQLLGGFPSSSTRWTGQSENLMSFDGENSNNRKLEGYKLKSLDFDHQSEENVVSSRNGGDEAQGNVDSWLCPSD